MRRVFIDVDRFLLGTLLLGFILRFAFWRLGAEWTSVEGALRWPDERLYFTLSRAIQAQGLEYFISDERVTWVAPGNPLYLGLLNWVRLIKAVNIVASTATIGFVFGVARRMSHHVGVARVAALLTATSPLLIEYAATILTEALVRHTQVWLPARAGDGCVRSAGAGRLRPAPEGRGCSQPGHDDRSKARAAHHGAVGALPPLRMGGTLGVPGGAPGALSENELQPRDFERPRDIQRVETKAHDCAILFPGGSGFGRIQPEHVVAPLVGQTDKPDLCGFPLGVPLVLSMGPEQLRIRRLGERVLQAEAEACHATGGNRANAEVDLRIVGTRHERSLHKPAPDDFKP